MKTLQNETAFQFKTRALRLALAAILVPAGMALARDGKYVRPSANLDASGHVEVVHQIPGGVISVGVEFGRPRPVIVEHRREVVVVEAPRHREREVIVVQAPEPRREVIVVERPRHHRRHVTVVREERCRPVTVIRTVNSDRCEKRVTVIEQNDNRGREHYYSDGNQVSYDKQGPNGNYHYYEDANQVSVDDNRNGQTSHLYVRK